MKAFKIQLFLLLFTLFSSNIIAQSSIQLKFKQIKRNGATIKVKSVAHYKDGVCYIPTTGEDAGKVLFHRDMEHYPLGGNNNFIKVVATKEGKVYTLTTQKQLFEFKSTNSNNYTSGYWKRIDQNGNNNFKDLTLGADDNIYLVKSSGSNLYWKYADEQLAVIGISANITSPKKMVFNQKNGTDQFWILDGLGTLKLVVNQNNTYTMTSSNKKFADISVGPDNKIYGVTQIFKITPRSSTNNSRVRIPNIQTQNKTYTYALKRIDSPTMLVDVQNPISNVRAVSIKLLQTAQWINELRGYYFEGKQQAFGIDKDGYLAMGYYQGKRVNNSNWVFHVKLTKIKNETVPGEVQATKINLVQKANQTLSNNGVFVDYGYANPLVLSTGQEKITNKTVTLTINRLEEAFLISDVLKIN